jgi:L-lactate dehydrogenase complex protein LldF
MIDHQLIDTYAREISDEKQTSVITGSAASTDKRYTILFKDYEDPDALRKLAGKIKDHTLHHLDRYVEEAEASLQRNGVQVHFADTGDDAKATILSILQ